MSSSNVSNDHADRGDLARKAALAVGVVFLAVGVLGFVPGVTTSFGELGFAGSSSTAKLLGVFQVSVLHNLVHLAFGVAGIAMSRRAAAAVTYLVGGGVVYLVLVVYGLLVPMSSSANFVPVDDADNWLHLALGIGMVGLGIAARQTARLEGTAVRR